MPSEASESPTREEWEVVVKRIGSIDAITSAAGRRPSEVTHGNVIFGDFNDDEKASAFARKMTSAGYIATSGPRREYTLYEKVPSESAAESRGVTSRQELGALMHNWHATGGDPLYAVGSYYYRDEPYPRKETVEAAKAEAERILRRLSSQSAERKEVRRIVRGLDYYLLVDYPASIAGEGVAIVEKTTAVVAATEGDASAMSETCKTCIPWQKVSRDGQEHAEFAELSKRYGLIKTPVEVYAVVGDDLNNETQEVFLLLPLNIHGNLMAPPYEIARGQRDRVAVGIDNVMDAASDARCAGFLVCHQHPGGSPKPSKKDIQLTKDIRKATPPGRTFVDHVIIGPKKAYSVTESKLYEIP
jgi:RadC-like JAB domain-containing protein